MLCTREFTFEAAHRLLGYDGKCQYLHGHSYVVQVSVAASIGDDGIAIDFAELGKLEQQVKDLWDHKTILHRDDPLCQVLRDAGQQVYEMSGNPTAENMAKFLFSWLEVPKGAGIMRIKLWETAKCHVTADRLGLIV